MDHHHHHQQQQHHHQQYHQPQEHQYHDQSHSYDQNMYGSQQHDYQHSQPIHSQDSSGGYYDSQSSRYYGSQDSYQAENEQNEAAMRDIQNYFFPPCIAVLQQRAEFVSQPPAVLKQTLAKRYKLYHGIVQCLGAVYAAIDANKAAALYTEISKLKDNPTRILSMYLDVLRNESCKYNIGDRDCFIKHASTLCCEILKQSPEVTSGDITASHNEFRRKLISDFKVLCASDYWFSGTVFVFVFMNHPDIKALHLEKTKYGSHCVTSLERACAILTRFPMYGTGGITEIYERAKIWLEKHIMEKFYKNDRDYWKLPEGGGFADVSTVAGYMRQSETAHKDIDHRFRESIFRKLFPFRLIMNGAISAYTFVVQLVVPHVWGKDPRATSIMKDLTSRKSYRQEELTKAFEDFLYLVFHPRNHDDRLSLHFARTVTGRIYEEMKAYMEQQFSDAGREIFAEYHNALSSRGVGNTWLADFLYRMVDKWGEKNYNRQFLDNMKRNLHQKYLSLLREMFLNKQSQHIPQPQEQPIEAPNRARKSLTHRSSQSQLRAAQSSRQQMLQQSKATAAPGQVPVMHQEFNAEAVKVKTEPQPLKPPPPPSISATKVVSANAVALPRDVRQMRGIFAPARLQKCIGKPSVPLSRDAENYVVDQASQFLKHLIAEVIVNARHRVVSDVSPSDNRFTLKSQSAHINELLASTKEKMGILDADVDLLFYIFYRNPRDMAEKKQFIKEMREAGEAYSKRVRDLETEERHFGFGTCQKRTRRQREVEYDEFCNKRDEILLSEHVTPDPLEFIKNRGKKKQTEEQIEAMTSDLDRLTMYKNPIGDALRRLDPDYYY